LLLLLTVIRLLNNSEKLKVPNDDSLDKQTSFLGFGVNIQFEVEVVMLLLLLLVLLVLLLFTGVVIG